MEPPERYRPIIDDFDAFLAACERPLGNAVRVNTIKASVERTLAALAEEGIATEQADWNPASWDPRPTAGFDVDPFTAFYTRPGRGLGGAAGRPAPRAWRAGLGLLCCSRRKATQIAALMDDRGTVVANDNNLGRISALRFNAERLSARPARGDQRRRAQLLAVPLRLRRVRSNARRRALFLRGDDPEEPRRARQLV